MRKRWNEIFPARAVERIQGVVALPLVSLGDLGGGIHGLTGTGRLAPTPPALQIGGQVAGCRGPASRRAARPSIRAWEVAWR